MKYLITVTCAKNYAVLFVSYQPEHPGEGEKVPDGQDTQHQSGDNYTCQNVKHYMINNRDLNNTEEDRDSF